MNLIKRYINYVVVKNEDVKEVDYNEKFRPVFSSL